MDLYNRVAQELSRTVTLQYSTSFGSASRLYDADIRPHIFNIYAWVRMGDEIVDTYRGKDADQLLMDYKKETYRTLKNGFSTNPIIHSFCLTARAYGIDSALIDPFLESMALDLKPPKISTRSYYKKYIYGSAQVDGLMCLRVFTGNDTKVYNHLRPGAESLGAAFQKINFLRDFASDVKELGRSYFPEVKNKTLDETAKQKIITDIRHDFTHSLPALHQLPKNSRTAVAVAAQYYSELLDTLEHTPAHTISKERIRLSNWRKAQIIARVKTSYTLKRTVS